MAGHARAVPRFADRARIPAFADQQSGETALELMRAANEFEGHTATVAQLVLRVQDQGRHS
jgi:hypothetical protein